MYVVVPVGDTVLELPLPKLCDQLYVFAPLAVNTDVAPLHIADGLADALTDGNGFTVTLTVAVLVHPDAVPVTEYVVVAVGDTITVLDVPNPSLQLYVSAPLAVKVALCPAHIVDGVAVI